MRQFRNLMLGRRGAARILDVGGDESFWTGSGIPPSQITILNLHSRTAASEHPYVQADACRLPFADRTFDIVFSNSVIEHVGTWERQIAFAAEVRRVARAFWVQTPAREFFIEPHLIAPFIHWLPRRARRRLIRNFTLWGILTRPDAARVEAFLDEVRLLSQEEVQRLFPDSTLLRERFGPFTKSVVAARSFLPP